MHMHVPQARCRQSCRAPPPPPPGFTQRICGTHITVGGLSGSASSQQGGQKSQSQLPTEDNFPTTQLRVPTPKDDQHINRHEFSQDTQRGRTCHTHTPPPSAHCLGATTLTASEATPAAHPITPPPHMGLTPHTHAPHRGRNNTTPHNATASRWSHLCLFPSMTTSTAPYCRLRSTCARPPRSCCSLLRLLRMP